MAVKRARADEDKQYRKQAIMDAAWALYAQRAGKMPAVAEIAGAAGLAKGTVYLYFQTKEEIFLALFEAHLERWFRGVVERFADAAKPAPDEVVATVVEVVVAEPAMLRLASSVNAVLEQNIGADVIHGFKASLAEELRRYGAVLEAWFPWLSEGDGASLLLRTYAVIIGVWQMVSVPASAWAAMSEPDRALLLPELSGELEAALGALWRGTLVGDGGGADG